MLAFVLRVGQAIIRILPAAIARLLVLAVLVLAGLAHVSATRRIEVLERTQDRLETQNGHVLRALNELTAEVRGYREDIREENKALKAKRYEPKE